MKARIYHNPRCAKSRATKALLEARGIELEVIEYLRTPLTQQALGALLGKLGMNARDLLRTGEAEFKASGIQAQTATDAELIELMASQPKLIQRPIVEVGASARVGRPPENVLGLFE